MLEIKTNARRPRPLKSVIKIQPYFCHSHVNYTLFSLDFFARGTFLRFYPPANWKATRQLRLLLMGNTEHVFTRKLSQIIRSNSSTQ